MNNTALITGITGQDGSYLAEFLLSKNYKVVGLHRRSSVNNFERIKALKNKHNFTLQEFDLTDPSNVITTISNYKAQEFYNLAAQSHVGTSFNQPTTTFEIDTVGVVNILEAIRNYSPNTKFYQASTSEMFGRSYDVDKDGQKYQDENTILLPQSPYGVAKVAAHQMVQIYREAYGIHANSGILFNHESPRRGENFVTRKITKWIGEFVNSGKSEDFPKLRLGNLEARRDWGHAKDYVRAMWMMLQQPVPDDFVICTERTYTIGEFLDKAFGLIGISDWKEYVVQDPEFYRPAEVEYLRGRNRKAQKRLGWYPAITFDDLVEDMVNNDIQAVDYV